MNHAANSIRMNDAALPVAIPADHIGPVVLPGTNRQVWWTGRVAIGLRYEPNTERQPAGRSAQWLQDLMLAQGGRAGIFSLVEGVRSRWIADGRALPP
jgi:hypothetical protein